MTEKNERPTARDAEQERSLVFRERHRAPSWIVLLGTIVAVGSAAALAASVPSMSGRSVADASMLVTVLSIGTLVGLAAATQSLVITVREGRLVVWLTPFFRKAVPTVQITSVSETVIDPVTYGGVGVRRAPGKPPAVFQRGGTAAELRMRDGSTLILECDDVVGLAAAVR
ncbi:hypothetical protein HP467_00640 [Curtobacterium albidum]|uniref:Uncharacterized protein n=1 Tax=Curtobacterium citreum TaxID=2036 RepID=A0A850DQ22_9MICO|nr:hypothetical protein [Curtobacterium albidum]NUU26625.1 hypothetical protein [Curtobacterium albidum]